MRLSKIHWFIDVLSDLKCIIWGTIIPLIGSINVTGGSAERMMTRNQRHVAIWKWEIQKCMWRNWVTSAEVKKMKNDTMTILFFDSSRSPGETCFRHQPLPSSSVIVIIVQSKSNRYLLFFLFLRFFSPNNHTDRWSVLFLTPQCREDVVEVS